MENYLAYLTQTVLSLSHGPASRLRGRNTHIAAFWVRPPKWRNPNVHQISHRILLYNEISYQSEKQKNKTTIATMSLGLRHNVEQNEQTQKKVGNRIPLA